LFAVTATPLCLMHAIVSICRSVVKRPEYAPFSGGPSTFDHVTSPACSVGPPVV
jgi:hypothetical protein